MKIRISAVQMNLAKKLGITAEEYATQLANMPKTKKFAGEILPPYLESLAQQILNQQKDYEIEVDFD